MREIILDKWHPMGVSLDGRGGLVIAATSNYGLKGTGGLHIIPNIRQPQVHSEWSAPSAIYDVKSANQLSYAAAADGFIYQVDQYGRLHNKVKAHEREVNRLAVNSDRLASASWDGTAAVWDVPSLKSVQRIKSNGAGAAVNEVAFNGPVLACASMSGPITIWDVRSNRQIAKVPVNDAPLTIKYSPDGRLLAFAGLDNDIHVVDTNALKPLCTMKGHYRTVRQLSWLSNTQIMSVGYDMAVRWWDVTKGLLYKSDTRFTEFVVTCDVDVHQRCAVVGSWDRKITIYDDY